ncbi:L-asparaginase-like [Rhynchophorus ferrugineus]|uniref:L-asparaginase-like n=1 Tax=Rhynchophorus ferrugineus TaxID=354439 RepID=UPI003FCE4C75
MEQRKILVLYTGGTIGMKKNEDGVYVPVKEEFLKYICNISKLNSSDCKKRGEFIITFKDSSVFYKIQEYDKLIDSSYVTIKDWKQMASDIKDNYSQYDGFVILHGTDTLAYTASILSFMLDGLSKPVILTGAMISIFEDKTDAINNIYWSLYFASHYDISEVCIFFNKNLLRGNRTTKVDTGSYDGFSSPNFEPLATVNLDEKTVLGSDIIRERTNNPNNLRKNITLVIKNNLTEKIGVLFCTPTTNQVHIRRSLEGAKGLVILTFGNGNMNTDAEGVIETLRDAIKKGTVILNVTQCLKGSVMSNYEPGNDLHNIGVISGNDITTEAAYAKMVVLLQNNPVDIFKISVRGEMTVK